MKRFLLSVLAAITISITVACCGLNDVQAEQEEMFQTIYYGNNYYIVYENDTKVMYVVSNGVDNSGTFTLLVNQDGTPMVWMG